VSAAVAVGSIPFVEDIHYCCCCCCCCWVGIAQMEARRRGCHPGMEPSLPSHSVAESLLAELGIAFVVVVVVDTVGTVAGAIVAVGQE